MSIRRSISAVALALAALFGLLVPVPASANHANAYYHWGNGHPPAVWSQQWTIPDDVVRDAVNFWRDEGFVNGFQSPVPNWNGWCAAGQGSIDVCAVNYYSNEDLYYYGRTGIAYVVHGWDGGATRHIQSCTVQIRNDLTAASRQVVLRHEMGHCLGLGHSPNTSSVMRDPALTPYADQHDRDALWSMYVAHRWG